MANDKEHGINSLARSLTETVLTWFADKPPGGLLGVSWDDDATAAAEKLGLHCGQWTAWYGGGGYEACFDQEHPVEAFGQPSLLRLFRKDGRLQALALRFRECGPTRAHLTAAVGKTFHMTTTEGSPYKTFDNGSVVHLTYDSGDNTCELTVTGPTFGKVYKDQVLRSGFSNLISGLGPR